MGMKKKFVKMFLFSLLEGIFILMFMFLVDGIYNLTSLPIGVRNYSVLDLLFWLVPIFSIIISYIILLFFDSEKNKIN